MKMQIMLGNRDRKELVKAVSEILGTESRYLGAPGFCYDVGGCVIGRNGGIEIPEGTDAAAIAERLREMGFEREEEENRFCIALPAEGVDDRAMENLSRLISAKASLIQKALNADTLAVTKDSEKIVFGWFPDTPAPDEVSAYTQFLTALVRIAKEQQRVTAKASDVENEKYAMRCFLLRLGFIGKEYAGARKVLLSRLSGNTAFKCTNHKGDF